MNPIPFYIISLGCPKNRVDTERFLGSLAIPVRLVDKIGRAKVVFINTCAFIEPASRESIRSILECAEKIKSLQRKPLLIVGGCLPGRYSLKELIKEIPEVDLWLPAKERMQWEEKIIRLLNLSHAPNQGRLIIPNSYAWLKISEGCNHHCSFCTIPQIRGKLKSEPKNKLLFEARSLLAQGIKELALVAQDTAAWGRDFDQSADTLINLVRELANLPNLYWLRLLYLYPESISADLLKLIDEIGPPLLPYFDVPFQHSEKEVLKRMGRPFQTDPRKVIDNIRNIIPHGALRTTLIVGYPGETEAQFKNLCRFVTESRFQNLGVFTYYAEDGTAAVRMQDQIPAEIKEARKEELMEIQANISAELLSENIGKRLPVLVENDCSDQWPGLFSGRVWFQAPEIDGLTYISGENIKTGEIVEAEICHSQTYDLSALV